MFDLLRRLLFYHLPPHLLCRHAPRRKGNWPHKARYHRPLAAPIINFRMIPESKTRELHSHKNGRACTADTKKPPVRLSP